jgi:hypothetical protein
MMHLQRISVSREWPLGSSGPADRQARLLAALGQCISHTGTAILQQQPAQYLPVTNITYPTHAFCNDELLRSSAPAAPAKQPRRNAPTLQLTDDCSSHTHRVQSN